MVSRHATITHGSLFSGIGGFDLAAAWLGWTNVFHCEISPFCNRVLNFYWPQAVSVKNIIGYDWKKWKGKIDVLSGGWPCQKYSVAGSRGGDEPLKEEMLQAIRLIQPTWCVLENVHGFISKKFAGEHNRLCEQLESMGYDVQTYDIDAASCGIPTLERHIWIVAASNGQRLERLDQKAFSDFTIPAKPFQRSNKRTFRRWCLPQNRVCGMGEGISPELDTETISKKKWHKESLQAFGNAVVPQIAFYLFHTIQVAILYNNKKSNHENRTKKYSPQ